MSAVPVSPIRILRLKDVIAATGLRKSTIYALAQKSAATGFPRPFKLQPTNCSGWNSSQIEQWIADRIKASQAGGAQHGR